MTFAAADEFVRSRLAASKEDLIEFAFRRLLRGTRTKSPGTGRDVGCEGRPTGVLRRMAATDRNILRMASLRIDFTRKHPSAVVINEAVELAKAIWLKAVRPVRQRGCSTVWLPKTNPSIASVALSMARSTMATRPPWHGQTARLSQISPLSRLSRDRSPKTGLASPLPSAD